MNNTEAIEYSKEALEVKPLFYDKEFSVYVEGEDDVIFWESLFRIAGYENIHIEEVGGYLQLTPYMEKIVNEDTNIIVAADTDHRDFLGFDFQDERIIRTYGYSIENSMYSIQRVHQIIRKLSNNNPPAKREIKNWRISFSKEAKQLLIFSIANSLYGKGEVIFGDKCIRFLKNSTASELCPAKIDKFIADISVLFTEEEIQVATNLLEETTKDVWYLIKGHFLTNGVLNYVTKTVEKKTGKKPFLSLEALYALCVDNEELKDKETEDIKEMVNRIKSAMYKVAE